MEVDVHAGANGKTDVAPAPPPDVSPSSPLGKLRGKVAKSRKERVLHHPVPDIEEIVIVFGTLGEEELERIQKTSTDDSLFDACATIASACIGIYEKGDDGELHESGALLAAPSGEPLTFATLRLDEHGTCPEDQVKALFVADGDILTAQNKVLVHSGYDLSGLMEAIRKNS